MLSLIPGRKRQLKSAHRTLAHLRTALNVPVSVKLWDGSQVPLGEDESPFSIAINGPGTIGSLIRQPTLENVLRHYACGRLEIEGGDLIEFGDTARVQNSKARMKQLNKWYLFRQMLPFVFAGADAAKVTHEFAGGDVQRKAGETAQNQDYIQFHYDLGNDFYALFLGEEMQYSCAYFTDWQNTIDQAQHDKLDMICRKLRLKPDESFLDIGCGWGGLICHAAQHYGVVAHGVTLSQAQYDFVQAKIKRLGLEDRVLVELRDYSSLEGTYDKIASIGMFEHVGIANLPEYFKKLYSLLRDKGILLNHGITRGAKPDRKGFRKLRPEHKLIAKYIFPGAELDHIGHSVELMEASKFEVHDVEGWREHYAMTTRHWCQRLSARKEEAIAMVGPERYRLWVAYLAGVSFAFQDGSLRIFQVVASKHASKGQSELPQTRADLYAA
ncbi:MAG TPA: cyclopropane-fatty-acyl-phospholipid synthase family protein [Planctomycetaceae bacterium]|nr:cyclopropane-fatty-acyl-phospholipid synthase family protein [Planctomycetaceae bacterium]